MTRKEKKLKVAVCFSKEEEIMLVYHSVMSNVKYMKNQQQKASGSFLVGILVWEMC